MSDDELTLRLHGTEITITYVESRGSGACIDIEQGGRRWRVEVSAQGELEAIETTWRDGQLADLDQPDWLGDALARTRAVA